MTSRSILRTWLSVAVVSGVCLVPTVAYGAGAGATDAAWQAYLAGDYATAADQLGRLAETGEAKAEYYFGSLYSDGLAVQRSDAKAAQWFEKAATKGYTDAQFSLGFLYYHGSGAIAPDDRQAVRWLKKAADAGHGFAQALMGKMYAAGRGVESDPAQALQLFVAAADKGIVGAQYDAGLMLSSVGSTDSLVDAYKWFILASRQGYPGAGQNLDLLSDRLNDSEVARAMDMATAWTKKN